MALLHGLLGEQLSDLQLQIEIFPRTGSDDNRRRTGNGRVYAYV